MQFVQLVLTQALAQTAAAAPVKQPSTIEMFLPFIFIFAIFYFLMIRPQAKKQKEHQGFLGNLKRGEAVITSSGLFGIIESLNETFVTLEISSGVSVKILRGSIAAYQNSKKNEGN